MIVRIRHAEYDESVYLTDIDSADEAHDLVQSVEAHGCYLHGDDTYQNVVAQYVIAPTEAYFEIVVS